MASHIPRNHQIGAIGESNIRLLFQNWFWNVGNDVLDSGYDLTVEPDRDEYNGGRFLVQVKTTKQENRKTHLKVLVDKRRLREYSACSHPVFIVMVSLTDISNPPQFHWLHVQAWARKNRNRINGDGCINVHFDRSNNLEERDCFERYLKRVLTPPSKRIGGLLDVVNERELYLNSIDSDFTIKTAVVNGREEYTIFPKNNKKDLRATLLIRKNTKNNSLLKKTMQFGLPSTFEDVHLIPHNPLLVEAIGSPLALTKPISIQRAVDSGTITIRPNDDGHVRSYDIRNGASIYEGYSGQVFSNEKSNHILLLEISKGRSSLGFRKDILFNSEIAKLADLKDVGRLAKHSLISGGIRIDYRSTPAKFRMSAHMPINNENDPLVLWLKQACFLSDMHEIARYFQSTLTLSENSRYSNFDIRIAQLACDLLRGERIVINDFCGDQIILHKNQITAPTFIHEVCVKKRRVSCKLTIKIGTQIIAEMPIMVDLSKTRVFIEDKSDAIIVRILHPERSFISFDDPL